jgi:peroxiredoxin
MRSKPVVVAVLAAMSVVVTARAEFKVGAELPDFSLPAVDGKAVTLARSDGRLQLMIDQQAQKPSVLAVHLLQPDCLQCRVQLKELQALYATFGDRGLIVLGISHRGSPEELRQLGQDLGLTFPLLMGTGSELAKNFAAGDTLGIANQTGKIQYAQVGFGKGDEALWASAVNELLAGKAVNKATVDRERLAVGDLFPAVELSSLISGKPMGLIGKAGRLTFRDEQGVEKKRQGAVGFFSRY